MIIGEDILMQLIIIIWRIYSKFELNRFKKNLFNIFSPHSIPFDRFNTIHGYIIYFFYLFYIIWGLFHGLTSSITLFLGQCYYIQAFCKDLEFQFKRLDELKDNSNEKMGILVDIIQLNIKITE